jgi:magnesium transporter
VPSGGPSWFPLPRRGPSVVRGGNGAAQFDQTQLSAEEVARAVVDCGLYDHGERRGGRIELETALRKADACQDGFVWIGLHDPSPAVVEAVGEHFELHPLAVEDAVDAHQRPKLEVYGDSLFVVLKTARYIDSDELIDIGEVMVFLGPRFVVTVRHGDASPLHEVRLDLEAHPDLLSIGPSSVLYAVADRIVDDYSAVIEGIAVDVEEVEADVFSGVGRNHAERIYKLKREVLEFNRATGPLVDSVDRLARGKYDQIPDTIRAYFRDVNDHLLRVHDQLEGYRDLLTSVLEANLAQVTVRQNEDVRKISVVVALLAVPTLIAGIYGMNFDHMPELRWHLGYPAAIGLMVVLCLSLVAYFRRVGWLE